MVERMDPEQTQPAETTPEPNLTELLEQGLDAMEASDAEPVDVAAGTDEADAAEEPAERAEGGDPAPDEGLEDSPADGVDSDGDAATDAPAVVAPEHWSQDDKARFAGLPDDTTRKTLLDWRTQIEKGAQEKFTEASAIRKEVDEIGEALRPIDSIIQQNGLSRADAVARLVGADQLLRQDLGQGISAIIQGYGRSVAGTDQARQLVRQMAQQLGVEQGGQQQGEQPGDGQAKPDPRIAALERTVQEMRDQTQAQRDQQLAQIRQSAQTKLDSFVEAKAEDGTPKHPHYEAVKVVMGALMGSAREAGQMMTLEQAYEQAVWARPELREALTKAQQDAAAKAADEARRSKVAAAKAAGTPQTKSAPTRSADPSGGPVKDIGTLLEEGYDQLAGAAR